MEVVIEVQVDCIQCSNRNVVQYFRDFYLRVGTCLDDSGRHFARFVVYLSVAVERIAVTYPQGSLRFRRWPPSVQPDRIFLQLPSSPKEEACSTERLVFTTRLYVQCQNSDVNIPAKSLGCNQSKRLKPRTKRRGVIWQRLSHQHESREL